MIDPYDLEQTASRRVRETPLKEPSPKETPLKVEVTLPKKKFDPPWYVKLALWQLICNPVVTWWLLPLVLTIGVWMFGGQILWKKSSQPGPKTAIGKEVDEVLKSQEERARQRELEAKREIERARREQEARAQARRDTAAAAVKAIDDARRKSLIAEGAALGLTLNPEMDARSMERLIAGAKAAKAEEAERASLFARADAIGARYHRTATTARLRQKVAEYERMIEQYRSAMDEYQTRHARWLARIDGGNNAVCGACRREFYTEYRGKTTVGCPHCHIPNTASYARSRMQYPSEPEPPAQPTFDTIY